MAHTAHDGRAGNSPGPGTGPGPTLNSSLVAAATPRSARPAETAAEPNSTTSLRYAPILAPAGTTSSRGIRAACRGWSRTFRPMTWTRNGGTARPVPPESRSTRTLARQHRRSLPTPESDARFRRLGEGREQREGDRHRKRYRKQPPQTHDSAFWMHCHVKLTILRKATLRYAHWVSRAPPASPAHTRCILNKTVVLSRCPGSASAN